MDKATVNTIFNPSLSLEEQNDRWRSRTIKQVKRLKATNKKLIIVALCAILLSIVCSGFATFAMIRLAKTHDQLVAMEKKATSLAIELELKDTELAMMTDQFISVCDENKDLRYANETLGKNTTSLLEVNKSLSEENVALLEQANGYKAAAEEYAERSELYDKYSYAILRKDGSKTDITYDQLRTAESLMEETGVDVDLMLSMIMVESNGKEKAASKTSTARGYGQFLKGTGEFVYEKLLHKGNYDHSYALNGDTNIEMMATYLEYLNEQSPDLYAAIKGYRGEGGSILRDYVNKIDKFLAKKGKSVKTLSISKK